MDLQTLQGTKKWQIGPQKVRGPICLEPTMTTSHLIILTLQISVFYSWVTTFDHHHHCVIWAKVLFQLLSSLISFHSFIYPAIIIVKEKVQWLSSFIFSLCEKRVTHLCSEPAFSLCQQLQPTTASNQPIIAMQLLHTKNFSCQTGFESQDLNFYF